MVLERSGASVDTNKFASLMKVILICAVVLMCLICRAQTHLNAWTTNTQALLSYSGPEVDLLSATTMRITNGPVISFPDTTTMWLNVASNSIWYAFTNAPYYYPIGGTIKLFNGDNILKTNVFFGRNFAYSNFAWAFEIDGQNPIHNTIIFLNTNGPTEGLLFFGSPATNDNVALGDNGRFVIRNVGLYAPNQSNDVLYVDGANYAEADNIYGGVTNNLYGSNGRTLVLGPLAGSPWNLTVMRFQQRDDNKFVAQNCMLNAAEYGIVEDCDHALNINIQGGGMINNGNAAVIHSRVNQEDTEMGIHAVDCDNGILYDSSLYTYNQTFYANYFPGNYQDNGVTYMLNINSFNGSHAALWNVIGAAQTLNPIAPGPQPEQFTIFNPHNEPLGCIGFNTGLAGLSGNANGVITLTGGTNAVEEVDTANNVLDDGFGNSQTANTASASTFSGGTFNGVTFNGSFSGNGSAVTSLRLIMTSQAAPTFVPPYTGTTTNWIMESIGGIPELIATNNGLGSLTVINMRVN